MKGESEEGEKYDPFDPTGSPLSNPDDGGGKPRLVGRADSTDDEKQNDKDCPDSTDTAVAQQSPFLVTLKKKGGAERELTDSDRSDLEEGEIVGAVDRGQGRKRAGGALLHLHSPNVSFLGPKPERILRVLDGDGFVSVCAEGSWEEEEEPEEEPLVEVEDLRRKLVSRRKERYSLSFPVSSPLSSLLPPSPSDPAGPSTSPLTLPLEQDAKNPKASANSKEKERQKSKDRKAGKKEERRRKKRKDRVGAGQEASKEKERGRKGAKEVKAARSSSHKRKKRTHSSPPPASPSAHLERRPHGRATFTSYDRHRDRKGGKEREPERTTDKKKEGRSTDRKKDRAPSPAASSHRRDEEDGRKERERKEREREDRERERHSSGGRDAVSKRSNRCREKREGEREQQQRQQQQRERTWGRDGRPVVPPSIQDLNGSDLFAIKRTITVTTTTTTTTVPGSPRLAPPSPCWSKQDAEQPRNRKKKRKWQHSAGEEKERGGGGSRSRSFSPPKYHSFESDRYSEKMDIDVLSLDGEAMDSDYPSLEDTPPGPVASAPPILSPKTKMSSKAGRHHPRKKSHAFKKAGPSESSSSRTKNKCLSSLMVSSGATLSGPLAPKPSKKVLKGKEQDKGRRKDGGKSSKETGGRSRKGKLQSKVSVLVREGVSSTTDTSVGSGKLGMDLLGSGSSGGGGGGGGGGAVVGGSIAVVFCRDNESRSPFLKPCSELSALGARAKDGKVKKSSLAAASFTSPAPLKSKKAKARSITSSSSSSASSPSSSLVTKHSRRVAKKTRDKGAVSGATGTCSQSNAASEGWGEAALDALSAVEDGSKSASPRPDQACPPPCSSSSSSSSSASALPPSSSPPHTPPASAAPAQDAGDSSPDSQTVDSSCKTPDPPFQGDDSPNQSSPVLAQSSPPGLSTPQSGASLADCAPAAKAPASDEAPKTLLSPSCSSSSASGGPAPPSAPPSSSEPSSCVSSSSASKAAAAAPPPPAPALPWSLQTGVDCATGGVLALTALLFKMEEANFASRAKAQEFIQATSQILSQANQSQSQQLAPPPSSAPSSQIPPPPSLPAHPELSPAQFILHGSLPLVGCSKTPPTHLHPSIGAGCFQAPPTILPGGPSGLGGTSGDSAWDGVSKDSDKYLKKLHTQERAVEEVKLAIKPYYQRKDINKDEYKDILRKAVHKICHSRTGEINPVKVSNLVKLYVQRYKYFRKHGRKMDDEEPLHILD